MLVAAGLGYVIICYFGCVTANHYIYKKKNCAVLYKQVHTSSRRRTRRNKYIIKSLNNKIKKKKINTKLANNNIKSGTFSYKSNIKGVNYSHKIKNTKKCMNCFDYLYSPICGL